MSQETAVERFQRLLNEANLTAQLTMPKIRPMQDGALLIEQPSLSVTFTDPAKESLSEGTVNALKAVKEVSDGQPAEPATPESTAEAVAEAPSN